MLLCGVFVGEVKMGCRKEEFSQRTWEMLTRGGAEDLRDKSFFQS